MKQLHQLIKRAALLSSSPSSRSTYVTSRVLSCFSGAAERDPVKPGTVTAALRLETPPAGFYWAARQVVATAALRGAA